MTKYRAEQSIGISGWECGTEIELKMVVTFTMTKHYPASDTGPEEFPQAEIYNIRFFREREKVSVEAVMPMFICEAFYDSDEFKSWLASEARDQDEAAKDAAAEARREDLRHA